MTIKDARPGEVFGEYTICFNETDETLFFATSLHELEELRRDFCAENGFSENSVDYVYRSASPLDVLEDFMTEFSPKLWVDNDGWHVIIGGEETIYQSHNTMIHEMYNAI